MSDKRQTETVTDILMKYGYAKDSVSAVKMFYAYEWVVDEQYVMTDPYTEILPYQSVSCGNTLRFSPQDFNGVREVIFR